MKNQISLIILFFLFIVSCNNDNNICHLTGKLENAPDTTTLFLADWESKTLFDSIRITNGLIDYKFQISHPKYFLLHNERNQYQFRDKKFIWLEPNEIKINGDFNFMKNIVLEGSASQREFESFILLKETAGKQINELKEKIHFKTNGEKKKDTLKINSLENKLNDDIVSFLINHSNSFVTLNSLHEESYLAFRHLNKKQIQSIYNELSKDLKKTEKGIEIKKFFELPEPPTIGDTAPEIIQLTPNNDTIRLSDYIGKYVLLEFWASDCAPCRGSNKWLRKIYSKYNPKGFEILSVSGDNNHKRWTDAIAKDSIPWQNISDLNGWQNEAFLLYDIKFIPQNFLINPEGKIINWKLCSESYTDYEIGKIFEN